MSRRQFAAGLAGLSAGTLLAPMRKAWAQHASIRLAVSIDTLMGANVNDARAAYRVWIDQIMQSLHFHNTSIVNDIFLSSADLMPMIRAGRLDAFVLTAWEYENVVDAIDPNWAIFEDSVANGLDYLLLVHNSSPYRKIEDLKGGKLLLHRNRDTTMLRAWLDIELATAGRPDCSQFFEATETHEQTAEVILPVFFRKAQAAGLGRRAFNMAIELNPQLGRELRVIATSPRIIPEGFWFHKGCNEGDRSAFAQAVFEIEKVPAGRQILAIYQTTGFCRRPCSIMNGTVEMIHQYQRLHRKSAAARIPM